MQLGASLGRYLAIGRTIVARHGQLLRGVIMLGLLTLVVTRVDVGAFFGDLRHAAPLPLVLAGTLAFAGWVFNTFKWQQLLAGGGVHRRFGELYRLNLISHYYSLALAGQMTGELVKAIRLSRTAERRGVVFGSIFLDRVTGLAALACLGGIGIVIDPWPAGTIWSPREALLIVGAVLAACLAVLWAPRIDSFVEQLEAAVPGLRAPAAVAHRLFRVVRRLGLHQSTGTLVQALVLSVLFQGVVVGLNWCIALAIGAPISPFALAWVMFAVAMLQTLPIVLAGVGVRELTFVTLLGAYGVVGHQALAIAELSFGSMLLLGLTGWIIDFRSARQPEVALPSEASAGEPAIDRQPARAGRPAFSSSGQRPTHP